MMATRVALTVKDFNYYIGHAYASLSRLHVNLTAPPPRVIRLTAPKRTETRRMMHQQHHQHQQRHVPAPTRPGEPPSSYIVDISKNDQPGESTRAIVNRTRPPGSGSRPSASGSQPSGSQPPASESQPPTSGSQPPAASSGTEGGGATSEGGATAGGDEGSGGGGGEESGFGGGMGMGLFPGLGFMGFGMGMGLGMPMGIPRPRSESDEPEFESGIPNLGHLIPPQGYEVSIVITQPSLLHVQWRPGVYIYIIA